MVFSSTLFSDVSSRKFCLKSKGSQRKFHQSECKVNFVKKEISLLIISQMELWTITVKILDSEFYSFIIKPQYTSAILRAGQIYFTRPIYRVRNFICASDRTGKKKTGAQNQTQCRPLIEKQLETTTFVLCYLNRTCSLHFYCNFIKSFCKEVHAV